MTTLKTLLAGSIALLSAAPLATLAQARYTPTTLPSDFAPQAINNRGQIVGTAQATAAVFDARGTVVLPIPSSTGRNINDRGDVVGQLTPPGTFGPSGRHGFAYREDRLIDLQPALPERFVGSQGMDINNAGVIAGVALPEVGESYRGFVYYKGRVQIIPTLGGDWSWATAINAQGVVAGYAAYEGGPALNEHHRAFLFHNGSMQDLGTFGGINSEAYDINNRGQVVGLADNAAGVFHPFLYEHGRMNDLGTLGGNFASAQAINDAGIIVGQSDTANDPLSHAFVYAHHRMFDLDRLVALPPGWHLLAAQDINDAGQILARACMRVPSEPAACHTGQWLRLDPVEREH